MGKKPKTDKAKASNSQIRKRVQEVLNLRLASAETWDICQYASAQG